VTTSRILPVANLIGCLLITGIIVVQWLKERGFNHRIETLNEELVIARDEVESGKTRAAALENDVSQLKESVESTVLARKEAEDALARLNAERDAQVASQTEAAQKLMQEQVQIWEKAIADRDAKIRELGTTLGTTRARLDVAIEKLKEAGAR
jgi:chromosome segregation ATPase